MKQQIYRVEPDSDYDLNHKDNHYHLYVVDFLLDSLGVWYKTRDRPGTYNSEKFRCEKVINKISLLLKKVTTKPTNQLRERVTVDMRSILRSMIEQLPYFSEQTRAHSLRLIRDHLQQYLE